MGIVMDLMEERFEEFAEDGALLLNEDYLIKMFSNFADEADAFVDYLQFTFIEKLSKIVGDCVSNDDKVLPNDELQAELFYPSLDDTWQTCYLVCSLAKEAAKTFLIEFGDTSKETSNYLSSIDGKFSIANITEDDRKGLF